MGEKKKLKLVRLLGDEKNAAASAPGGKFPVKKKQVKFGKRKVAAFPPLFKKAREGGKNMPSSDRINDFSPEGSSLV